MDGWGVAGLIGGSRGWDVGCGGLGLCDRKVREKEVGGFGLADWRVPEIGD